MTADARRRVRAQTDRRRNSAVFDRFLRDLYGEVPAPVREDVDQEQEAS